MVPTHNQRRNRASVAMRRSDAWIRLRGLPVADGIEERPALAGERRQNDRSRLIVDVFSTARTLEWLVPRTSAWVDSI